MYFYIPRYAEIRYTQGGFENLEQAKVYYCHAIRLNPNNMRALYGLLLVSSYMSLPCPPLKFVTGPTSSEGQEKDKPTPSSVRTQFNVWDP